MLEKLQNVVKKLKCQMQGQNLQNIIEKNVSLAHREEEQAFDMPQAKFQITLPIHWPSSSEAKIAQLCSVQKIPRVSIITNC